MQSDKAKNILHYLSKEYKRIQSKIVPKSLIITLKEQPVHCSVQILTNVM